MKLRIYSKITLLNLCVISNVMADKTIYYDDLKPKDFVDVTTIIPNIQLDVRYATNHNFIGRKIVGYSIAQCLLTKKAAISLKKVQDQLIPMGLSLKVYDCYRPQIAVDDFYAWSKDPTQNEMKKEFYPDLDKNVLFKQNYIAKLSGHSRGSTVDLTIVPLNSTIPAYENKQMKCTNPDKKERNADNSLDFGTSFDCFSTLSHTITANINPQAMANRLLLKNLMQQAGFKGMDEEWWHFTLKNEPYKDTYFTFPIQ